MPSFSVLAPIAGSLLKSASDNTNRRNQFEQGNIRNTFSIFTGGPRTDLASLRQNNSANALTARQNGVGTAVAPQVLNSAIANATQTPIVLNSPNAAAVPQNFNNLGINPALLGLA